MIDLNGKNATKDDKILFTLNAEIRPSIECLAKRLAELLSDKQAIFFNEFAKWVNILCKEKTGRIGEFQFMYVADDLNEEAIEMMEAMLYRINAEKKEKSK